MRSIVRKSKAKESSLNNRCNDCMIINYLCEKKFEKAFLRSKKDSIFLWSRHPLYPGSPACAYYWNDNKVKLYTRCSLFLPLLKTKSFQICFVNKFVVRIILKLSWYFWFFLFFSGFPLFLFLELIKGLSCTLRLNCLSAWVGQIQIRHRVVNSSASHHGDLVCDSEKVCDPRLLRFQQVL